jgi:peptidoglycan/xylan/chitin deacetylase (PgdA/CDA1 family)
MKKYRWILLAVLLAAVGIFCRRSTLRTESQNAGYTEASQEDAADALRQVAITFDDGPNPDYTLKLLEGLKKRGVKATFFVLGEEVENYPDILGAIYDEGHLIGIHSYQHVNFTEIGDNATLEQINRTQEAICAVTGEYAGYIRPPYGSWRKELDTKVPLIEVLWDVDPMDWATNDADTVVRRVEAHVEDGSIILLHDASESTVQAAFRIIDLLQGQGYEFVTVETLLVE